MSRNHHLLLRGSPHRVFIAPETWRQGREIIWSPLTNVYVDNVIPTRVTYIAHAHVPAMYTRVHRRPCARQMSERRDAASRRSSFSHAVRSRRGAGGQEKKRERGGTRWMWRTEPFSRSHEAAPCATTTTTRTTTTSDVRARYISPRRRSSRLRSFQRII